MCCCNRYMCCTVPTAVQPTCRWSASGTLWLTDVRLVFVAPAANADGLQAFDFPLAYITHDKFNQPIFACNNLAGQALVLVATSATAMPHTVGCNMTVATRQPAGPSSPCSPVTGKVWPATGGGGPAGTLPPHEYKLYFKARIMGQASASACGHLRAGFVPAACTQCLCWFSAQRGVKPLCLTERALQGLFAIN